METEEQDLSVLLRRLEHANKTIGTQQSDIIMLEIERDGLNQEIKKLKERNANQAKLLKAIEDGTAKKCTNGGGWYKP